MDISGIGGAMPMLGSLAPLNCAPALPTGSAGLPVCAMGRMDQLAQLIQGFSSAEILMALLMSHGQAQNHQPAEAAGSEALAALQLAFVQSGPMAVPMPVSAGMAVAAGIGAQISVQG